MVALRYTLINSILVFRVLSDKREVPPPVSCPCTFFPASFGRRPHVVTEPRLCQRFCMHGLHLGTPTAVLKHMSPHTAAQPNR